MKENYQLLGLDETATDEQIKEKYHELKKKYSEDRWLDGEAGNEAARMLGKIDQAYLDIMNSRREQEREQHKAGHVMQEVADAIRSENLDRAQQLLDDCDERTAEWHYYQSVLFYRKNWMNESKKQLEIAMQLDANNEKYKDAYQRLNDKMNFQGQSARPAGEQQNTQSASPDGQQMGGTGCSQCLECCYTYLCVNCLFNLCCNCR